MAAVKESLLQHLGPPSSAIDLSALEVIRFDSFHDRPVSGVAFVIILMNIPVLTAAPQHPHRPQAPPGYSLPLAFIS